MEKKQNGEKKKNSRTHKHMKPTRKVNWLFTKGNVCRIASVRIHWFSWSRLFWIIKRLCFQYPSRVVVAVVVVIPGFFSLHFYRQLFFFVSVIVTYFCRATFGQRLNAVICDKFFAIQYRFVVFFFSKSCAHMIFQYAIERENYYFFFHSLHNFSLLRLLLERYCFVRTSKWS